MSRIYLGLGTNLGDRYANLQRAVDELQKILTITAVSPVFSTEPWGDVDQPSFLNICLAAVGSLSPHDLLAQIRRIEQDLGRLPSRRWGPRLIDIDILFYDSLILSDEKLTIPHPHIAERAFVLAPLAVIIPDFRHPQTGISVREMLDNVDSSGVERLFEMPFPSETRAMNPSPA
jgi:2-amino-4-hydroxy-6-hydroxymethyldihydropteridine diphosphokinase